MIVSDAAVIPVNKKSLTLIKEFVSLRNKERVVGSRNSVTFLEVKGWMVGPLSEDRTSGSGFFVGLKKDSGTEFLEKFQHRLNGLIYWYR